MLKLPKSFDVELGLPRRKPTGAVEIDWSNPITKGLTVCYLPRIAGAVDLCNHKLTVVTAKPVDMIKRGRQVTKHGLLTGSTVSEKAAYKSEQSVSHNNEITFVVKSRPNRSTDSGDYIAGAKSGFVSNRTAGNHGLTYSQDGAVGGSPNPGRQMFTIQNIANYAATDYNLSGAGFQLHGCSARSNSVVRFYTDGVFKEQLSIGAFTTGEDYWLLGTKGPDSAPTDHAYSHIELIYVFNRVLSDAEWLALEVNPYQILKPANDFYYFLPTGGGANYTLTADAGSYTLGSGTVNLLADRTLAADVGSYTLSGDDVSLQYGLTIAAEAGSYTLGADAVNLLYGRLLGATAGSYALGSDGVNFVIDRTLAADVGSYALGGDSVTLTYAPLDTMEAGTAVYTLSSDPVTFLVGRRGVVDVATYSVTIADATFTIEALSTGDCFTWLESDITEALYLTSYISGIENYVVSDIDGEPTYLTSEITGDGIYLTGGWCP